MKIADDEREDESEISMPSQYQFTVKLFSLIKRRSIRALRVSRFHAVEVRLPDQETEWIRVVFEPRSKCIRPHNWLKPLDTESE